MPLNDFGFAQLTAALSVAAAAVTLNPATVAEPPAAVALGCPPPPPR